MRVITRFVVGIYTAQQLYCRFVIRVLWNKFAVYGEVENFRFNICNYLIQFDNLFIHKVNIRKPLLYRFDYPFLHR